MTFLEPPKIGVEIARKLNRSTMLGNEGRSIGEAERRESFLIVEGRKNESALVHMSEFFW